jgi:PIN domain nuclease of toxin-antitoxin system
MRRAFLDSQVAFWLATGDKRITPQVLRVINSHSVTSISAITLAELEMKAAIEKLAIPANLSLVFEKAGLTIEPFDSMASEQLRRFPQLNRHDPFDRLILAQAASKVGATFFTADQALIELGLDWVVGV